MFKKFTCIFIKKRTSKNLLLAVCVYFFSGSCYGGHYHAYIRDVEGLKTWFEPVRRILQYYIHPEELCRSRQLL